MHCLSTFIVSVDVITTTTDVANVSVVYTPVAPPCVGCEGEEDIINPDTFPFANASGELRRSSLY